MRSSLVATDALILPALLGVYLCFRWRRRLGRSILGVVTPVAALVVLFVAGYWGWYFHRPQPTEERSELLPGVVYHLEPRTSPRPVVLHWVEIDLTRPDLEFFVTPEEPTGDFQLPARTTSGFALEFDLRVAINASYFYPFRADNPLSYYPHEGDPVNVVGSCASDGRWYSKPVEGYTLFSITHDNKAAIGPPTGWVRSAVSGRPRLLAGGTIDGDLEDDEPGPRTAIVLDRMGTRMTWLVVDGRQPRYSEGVTLKELAALCCEAGGWDALALDGGGSTTLVERGDDGVPRVLNCPVHGRHPPGRERPVANHLGVRVRP